MRKILNKNVLIYFVLIITSFLYVLFNTAMSPLFDASYITHDASVFYVIGRGMKYGLVPYKDLFDHKGIYIFFLYYIAAIIGESNSIGLLVVFSILVSVFTIFIYKISKLFKGEITSIFSAFTISMLSTSLYFSHGALLCEYLALVTIVISMHIMLRQIINNPVKRFSPKYMFINGILASINLFNKSNYILYFVAVGIYVLIDVLVLRKDYILFIKNIISGVIGLIVGALPVFIYCVYNNCLNDMFFAVFTFNFSYIDDISIDLPKEIITKPQAFFYTLKSYINMYLLIILSIIVLFYNKVKRQIIYFYLLSLICLSISIFMALTGYTHYLTLLLPFILPIVLLFFEKVQGTLSNTNILNIKYILKVAMVFVVLFFSAYLCGGEQIKINYYRSAQEAKRVKKEINKYAKLDKKTKFLAVGFGCDYYNYLNVVPKEKYYYIPSITYKKYNKPIDEVWENISQYKSDIVFYAVNPELQKQIGDKFLMFLEEKYIKILDLSEYKKVYITKYISTLKGN